MSESQADTPTDQILLELAHGTGGRIVDMSDSSSIDYHPPHWCYRLFDERTNLFREAVNVGIEKRRTKPVDHKAGLGFRAGNDRGEPPLPLRILHQHRRVRMIAVVHNP